MHGQFLIHITICIEVIALLAGLSFLAKAKKESYGRIYTILACLSLTIITLVLACTLWAGISRMCCHKEKSECKEMQMEKCMKEMGCEKMMMMYGHGGCDMEGMESKCCKEKMEGCKDMDKEECPYDKNGKCMGDEKKCKMEKGEGMAKDTLKKATKK